MKTKTEPKFLLGRVVVTADAQRTLCGEDVRKALARHAAGDWGDVGPVDWQMNQMALEDGDRLLSVYYDEEGETFWVITEADRSVTTVLLPEDD